jgi:hypothetical protein
MLMIKSKFVCLFYHKHFIVSLPLNLAMNVRIMKRGKSVHRFVHQITVNKNIQMQHATISKMLLSYRSYKEISHLKQTNLAFWILA